MSSSFSNVSLLIPRHHDLQCLDNKPDLRSPSLVQDEFAFSSTNPLPENSIVVRIEKFGFTANNVTYGALGNVPHFRYFDFHSVPSSVSPSSFGIIPVWGFGTVVLSTLPPNIVGVGELLYGYLAMTKFTVLKIDVKDSNKFALMVPRSHLPKDRRPYNTLLRCSVDPHYFPSSLSENLSMIYRPLFWTSFWLGDYIVQNNAFNAQQILVSSASSKTAFLLAYVLKKLTKSALSSSSSSVLQVIGLTSESNLEFTNKLNLYDKVLPYSSLPSLVADTQSKYLYIDIASNQSINKKLQNHLTKSLLRSIVVGMTNVDEVLRAASSFDSSSSPSSSSSSSSSPSPSTRSPVSSFFMVEWLSHRRASLSVPTITSMQQVAWSSLMNDCKSWLSLTKVYGASAVKEAYLATVDSKIKPNVGQVFSMWDNENDSERLAKQQTTAKKSML